MQCVSSFIVIPAPMITYLNTSDIDEQGDYLGSCAGEYASSLP